MKIPARKPIIAEPGDAVVECASPPCSLHELDPAFADWAAKPPTVCKLASPAESTPLAPGQDLG
ncbi:MAG: hypothetical protein POG74_03375 [Acidocella sp.]|nr:hypothetical protein [Acidocella sp.]